MLYVDGMDGAMADQRVGKREVSKGKRVQKFCQARLKN